MYNYKRASLLLGFSIWLVATIVFRIAGQSFFLVDNPTVLALLYLSTPPALMVLAHLFFTRFRLVGIQPALAAGLMVIPGMVLDTFVILFFAHFMPNLPVHADAEFGSWLMWAYSSVLIYGVVKSR